MSPWTTEGMSENVLPYSRESSTMGHVDTNNTFKNDNGRSSREDSVAMRGHQQPLAPQLNIEMLASQLNRMQMMQDSLLRKKETEMLLLRQMVDQQRQQLAEKQLEVAVLKEQLSNQHHRLQHAAKLRKLMRTKKLTKKQLIQEIRIQMNKNIEAAEEAEKKQEKTKTTKVANNNHNGSEPMATTTATVSQEKHRRAANEKQDRIRKAQKLEASRHERATEGTRTREPVADNEIAVHEMVPNESKQSVSKSSSSSRMSANNNIETRWEVVDRDSDNEDSEGTKEESNSRSTPRLDNMDAAPATSHEMTESPEDDPHVNENMPPDFEQEEEDALEASSVGVLRSEIPTSFVADQISVNEELTMGTFQNSLPAAKNDIKVLEGSVIPSPEGDCQKVEEQELADPYGDRGIYSGVVLLETGMPHGHGHMEYEDDGRSYLGDWRHGMWHGFGQAIFANGDTYQGEYSFDQRNGRGTYSWSDGRVYDGMFENDKRNGKGTFKWPDGATYEGDFVHGQREGQGRYEFSDGGFYEGAWVNGFYEGHGECHWKDGRSYKGEWKEGKANGRGVETYPDGQMRHDGLWIDDKPIRDNLES